MKKYLTIICISVFGFSFSQITIGKTNNNGAPANSSVSLELGNETGGVKGFVVPWVTSGAAVVGTNPTPAPALGTIIFDTTIQKVMYRRIVGSTTIWEDLSVGSQSPTPTNQPDSNTENTGAKVQIGGAANDATRGVLVLGDNAKAMVLPRVSSIAEIANPSAGMMVYVTGTSNGTGSNSNQLAVFNGREWSFWTKQ